MDIISHGLWAGVVAKFAEKKSGKPLNAWLAAFWGIFPDLFAFTVPFIWLFVEVISGDIAVSKLPKPDAGEPPGFLSNLKVFQLASSLYNVSHSLIVFGACLLFAYWILKRMPWEMFGWLFHILIDIPTHPYNFFPTPLFWPISTWKFTHGFAWGVAWFVTLDIIALISVYFYLWRKGMLFKKKK